MVVNASEGSAKLEINGMTVVLPAPLRQFIEWQGRVVVLVEPDSSYENVFAYDQSGRLLWTIEKFRYSEWDKLGYRLLRIGDGKLWAFGLSEHFELDIETGRILSSFSEK